MTSGASTVATTSGSASTARRWSARSNGACISLVTSIVFASIVFTRAWVVVCSNACAHDACTCSSTAAEAISLPAAPLGIHRTWYDRSIPWRSSVSFAVAVPMTAKEPTVASVRAVVSPSARVWDSSRTWSAVRIAVLGAVLGTVLTAVRNACARSCWCCASMRWALSSTDATSAYSGEMTHLYARRSSAGAVVFAHRGPRCPTSPRSTATRTAWRSSQSEADDKVPRYQDRFVAAAGSADFFAASAAFFVASSCV